MIYLNTRIYYIVYEAESVMATTVATQKRVHPVKIYNNI